LIRRLAVALFIAAFFLFFAAEGLTTSFGPDDLMNLYRWWSRPSSDLLRASVLYWTDAHRPMGGAFYTGLFALFGFNPLPFRIASLALVLLNLWLAYVVARRLTGSRAAAAIATLVFCYHPYLFDIYLSTGMIYDVLCFTFSLAALAFYFRIRGTGRTPSPLELAGTAALYICALNSKEMAVALPVLLGVYELAYHRGRLTRFLTPALLAALTVPYVAGKQALTGNPAYRPVFTLDVFFKMWTDYMQQLVHDAEPFNPGKLVLLWLLLALVAWRMRSRALALAWVWIFVTMLPIVFIPFHRAGFVLYLPWLGWALFAGVMLAKAAEFTERRFRLPAAQAAVFALTAAVLVPLNLRVAPDAQWAPLERAQVRSVIEQLRTHRLAPRSRVLVTGDRVPPDDYMLTFAVRLWYRDDSIALDRVKAMKVRPDPSRYDWVVSFE
jgi:hypothetical protein